MLNFLGHPISQSTPKEVSTEEPPCETRRRALAAGVGALGALGVTSLVAAPEAAAATIAQQDLATALGFWPVLSASPPAAGTQYGVPVVWLQQAGMLANVATIPKEPLWNDAKGNFTIPSGIVGVKYQDGSGAVLNQGATLPAPTPLPSKVSVAAVALPGYTLPATYSWSHWFPNSSVSTLVASDTFTGTDGTAVNNRKLDNGLGGSTALTWAPGGPDTYFKIAGNAIVNAAVTGSYAVNVGIRNHRIKVDLKWLPTTSPTYGLPAIFTVGGGGPGGANGAAYLMVGPRRWRLVHQVESGGLVELASGWATMANGTYQLEIFESQVGIRFPGMSTTAFYDATYVDQNKGLPPAVRSNLIRIWSDATYTTQPFSLDNIRLETIGGI